MKSLRYLSVVLFLALVSFPVLAQNTLIHTPQDIQLTVVDDGYLGDDGSGTVGLWKVGSYVNAMYTGGFVHGNEITGIRGVVGSFTDGTLPIIEDFANSSPMAGFTSNAQFDQLATWTVTDPEFPGVQFRYTSGSVESMPIIFIRLEVINNSGNDLTNHLFGIFSDLDVGGANYAQNNGGYVPANNLFYAYENRTTPSDPNYYGIVAITPGPEGATGWVGSDFGAWTAEDLRFVLWGVFNDGLFEPVPANDDMRVYVSAGLYDVPNTQTLTLDFALCTANTLEGLSAAANTAINYINNIPVELTSFTANTNGTNVNLNWTTATETNNLGFEIERKITTPEGEGQWATIAYKNGHGSTTETQNYSFVDDISNINATTISYRLKQLDFSGEFEYSEAVEVSIVSPVEFTLDQNFPNPFNPTTTIAYSIPEASYVTLKVFNSLGEEVSSLVNSEMAAGRYEVSFDATGLSSGIYFYTLQAGNFVSTKKLSLMK